MFFKIACHQHLTSYSSVFLQDLNTPRNEGTPVSDAKRPRVNSHDSGHGGGPPHDGSGNVVFGGFQQGGGRGNGGRWGGRGRGRGRW